MTNRFQFVAIVLALIFLTGTLFAAGPCLPEHAGTMPQPCCPSMNNALAAAMHCGEAAAGMSCCGPASAKQTAETTLQCTGNEVSVAPAPAVNAPLACALTVPGAELRDRAPSGLDSPPQAVLCTFLV